MGLISTPIINKRIASKRKEIREIKASIEKYEQGIKDAKKACEKYQKFISENKLLVDEISLYFKGTSAPALIMRLLETSSFCNQREMDMQHKINYYGSVIDNLKDRIEECKASIEKLEGYIDICKWLIL